MNKCYSCHRKAKYVDGLCVICNKIATRASNELEPLVRAELDRVAKWIGGLAYMAVRTEPKWRRLYRKSSGVADKRPLTTGAILERVADEVQRTMIRVTDPRICNDSCKSLYFCEKKLGHKGKHRTGGLAW